MKYSYFHFCVDNIFAGVYAGIYLVVPLYNMRYKRVCTGIITVTADQKCIGSFADTGVVRRITVGYGTRRHVMPTPRKANQQGFTLTELMVVVAIVSILAGVVFTEYGRQLPASRLNGAARHVLTDLMLARRQAISQSQRVKVYFPHNEQGDKSYKICFDADGNSTVADCEGNGRTTNIQANYYGVTVSANNDPVFQPGGTVSPTATITLTNARGTRQITLSTVGRVHIKNE
jgi:type IV fimbrial biogenesis protein FimT